MKHLNFLSKSSSRSMGHRVTTLALTVGSPSAHRRGAMLRLLSVLVLVLTFGVGNVWGSWSLCTSTSDFSANNYYMFVFETNSTYYYVKAPSSNVTQGDYSKTNASVTSSSDPSSLSLSNAGWKLISTSTSGQWKLQSYNSSSVYLYTGTENNKVGAGSATNASSYWTISKNASSNTFKLTYNLSTTRDLCGYESSPFGFRSYTSSSNSGVHYIQVYKWTSTPSYTITAQSSNNSYGSVSLSGSVITATPAENCRIASTAYTVTNGTATVTRGTGADINKFTVTPSSDCTVRINFEQAPTHTVIWSANGNTYNTSTVAEGAAIEFPESATGCDGGTFMGWASATISGTQATAPTYVTSANMGNTDVTYYAVFADITTGTGDWEQCTSSTIDEGDYLIASSSYMMTNTLSTSRFNRTSITVTDGVISYEAKDDWTPYIWHITETSTSGIFTIKNGTKYVIGTGVASKAELVSSPTDDKELFAITYQSTPKTYKIESKYNENAGVNRWLRDGGSYFACYADAGYPMLFKRGNGYSNFRTSCCTSLGSINGSVNWSQGEAELHRDKMDGVNSWAVAYKLHSDENYTSHSTAWTDEANNRCYTTTKISGLEAGQVYDFKITATPDGEHCAGDVVELIESVTVPQITTSAATITNLNYAEGNGPSAAQSFTVSGSHLTGNLTVTAPANFKVCATEKGEYTTSVELTPTEKALSNVAVYVKMNAGLSQAAQAYTDNITISGGGAASKSVALSGVVSSACEAPTINTQPAGATYNLNEAVTALSVVATKNGSGAALTYQWYGSATDDNTAGEPIEGATSSTYTPSTSAAGTNYYYCVVSSGACATPSACATIEVNTPAITVSGASVAFGDKAKDSSNELTFTVSGANLAKDAGITLTLNDETGMYSIDKTSLDATSNAVGETTITVTYAPTAIGTHNASITIASTGAEQTVNLSGTAKWTVTWNVNNGASETTTLVADGAKPVLPLAPADNTLSACANKFMGWSTKDGGTILRAATYYDDLFADAEHASAINDDVTFYAVFATAEDGYEDQAENYDSDEFGTTGAKWTAAGKQTLNNVSWTLAVDGSNFFGYDSNNSKGTQVGSSGDPAEGITLSTSEILGTITSVKITTSGANDIAGTVAVKVGSTDFTTGNSASKTANLTSSSTEYTFTGEASGIIEISWAQTSSKAIYFKQLKVDYTTQKITTVTNDYVTSCAAVAAPILNVEGGTYNEVQTVKISNYDGDFRYFYTTDGSDPAADTNLDPTGNSVAYNNTTGILIDKSCTLKVIGYNEGLEYSEINTVDYVLQVPAVTFGVPAGTYNTGAQTVTLSSIDGATIYYTTNGVDPTTESDVYNSAITVDANKTIKAFATKADWTASEIATAAYVINYPRTVTFNAGTGTAGEESLTEASYGAGITLPSATPSTYCAAEGWTFAGWATSNSTSVAPTLKAGDSYNCAANTLYAVYKNGDGKYHLITELPTGEDIPGTYVIVNTNGKVALEAAVKNTNYLYGCAISSITNGVINPADINADYRAKSVWQVTYESSKWIFYNANTEKYLYNYASSTNHYVGITSTKPSGYTLTLNNTGFTVFTSADDNGKHINWASSYSNFAQGEDENIHLYKLDETYSSTPSCCDDEVTIAKGSETNGTFTVKQADASVVGQTLGTCTSAQVVTVTCSPAAGHHVDAVMETIGTGVTIEETEENVYTITYAKNVSGTSTISVAFAETTEPSFSVSTSSIVIGNVAKDATIQRTFTISAANLEGETLTLTSDNDKYIVSPSALTITDGSVAETEVTITLNTAATGSYEATITLADGAATPNTATVAVSATVKNQYQVRWFDTDGEITASTKNYLEGETIDDKPVINETCDNSIVFVGWLPGATIEGKQEGAPAEMVTADDITTATASMDYHAVYAKETPSYWRETALADLTSDDVFVIVGHNGNNYAMTNDNGTSAAPAAPSITIENNKITSEVTAAMKWNVSGNATDGYTFYPNESTTAWLYCTDANNGVRVGTNSNKVFTIVAGYLKHTATNRYVGVYNNSDWRCYDSYTGSQCNIKNQEFAYFKYIAPTIKDYMTTCAVTFSATYEAGSGTGDDYVDANLIEKNADYTVLGNDVTGFTKTDYRFNGWKCGDDDYAAGATYENVTADLTFVAQWTEKEEAGLEYETSAYEVIQNGSFTKPALTNPHDLAVTYSSSNTAIATVDAEGNVTLKTDAIGSTTITASSEATDTYKAGEASYTLSVASKWALTYTSNVELVENSDTKASSAKVNGYDAMKCGTSEAAGAMQITVPKNTEKLHIHAVGWKGETVTISITGATASPNSVDLTADNAISGSGSSYTLNRPSTFYKEITLSNITEATTLTLTATNGKRFVVYGVNEEGGIWELPSDDADESDIPSEVNVVVSKDQSLTINNAKTLNNLIVEAGGKVSGSATLIVKDVIIESKSGATNAASGQIIDASKLDVNGDLFMDITLFTSAEGLIDANYWYSVAVPFDVDINSGIYRLDGTTATQLHNSADFDVWYYDTEYRASSKRTGWKRLNGKMEAGKAYLIGFDDGMSNKVRFKAAEGWKDNLYTANSIPLTQASDGGDGTHSNWNGIANPTMHYIGTTADVQVFDNDNHTYSQFTNYNYVVGTAFFVKATSELFAIGDVDANNEFRAPKRESENKYEFSVRICKGEAQGFDNQMYVRASEEASAEFDANRDITSMNSATAPSAMLWTENYGGKRLAIEVAPIVNNTASYVLGLYAPKAGQYRIEATDSYNNADLYLTYEGSIIWNLSMGAYEIELAKGATNGYGLLLQAKAPQVVTGVDEVDAETGVQKIIIDEHVFILRGGQMYDVTGKTVK